MSFLTFDTPAAIMRVPHMYVMTGLFYRLYLLTSISDKNIIFRVQLKKWHIISGRQGATFGCDEAKFDYECMSNELSMLLV